MFHLGLDNLVKNSTLLKTLKGRKVGLIGHPASVDKNLNHSLDILAEKLGGSLTCAFGPQHGMRGEKQDNMVESEDFRDPKHGIPVFSLYGRVRRPTQEMLDHCDVILFDLQDVGCRIYTFLTTLFYVMEDCAKAGKEVWVLDRPNAAGRPIEGNYLRPDFFSFVGAAEMPMRHGLTLGEAGLWYKDKMKLDLEYRVIKMSGYKPMKAPGYGWPIGELSWVNPSPNMPRLTNARMYAGTVLIEGTKLSEGRGTTIPLEILGSPEIDGEEVVAIMRKILPPKLLGKSVKLRPAFFEPTFQKHKGRLCSGLQIHIDQKDYHHGNFKPYRIVAAFLKAVRQTRPDIDLWLQPPYEYETVKMPIDILSGDSTLRNWVDDPAAKWADFERFLAPDEKRWEKERKKYLLY